MSWTLRKWRSRKGGKNNIDLQDVFKESVCGGGQVVWLCFFLYQPSIYFIKKQQKWIEPAIEPSSHFKATLGLSISVEVRLG